MKMVRVGMYADQTELFDEKEIYFDNWCELDIPEDIVREWYKEMNLAEDTSIELNIPIEEATFEKWLEEVSWGDDTDGLYDFSIRHGYEPKLNRSKPNKVLDADDNTVLFEGTENECREFGKKNHWKLNGKELFLADPWLGGK